MVELGGHLVQSCGGTQWIVIVELGGQLCGTQWTVVVELGGQLRWNLVDSCGGTQWTVELSG